MDRRKFLHQSLFTGFAGAFALDRLGGVPLFSSLTDPRILSRLAATDAWYNLAMVSQSVGHFLRLEHSMAQAQSSQDTWTLVTIKVVNHVHTPLVFKLGKRDGNIVTGDNPSIKSKSGEAGAHMELKGADAISDIPRFSNLRMNKWFADILATGKADTDILNNAGLQLSPFPDESKVAIQAALSLSQTMSNNHSLKAFKLATDRSELALHLGETGVIKSPLGIAAFNMGGNYDKAEGSNPTNVILGNVGEQPIFNGRPVKDFVSIVEQSVKAKHVDLQTDPQKNLTLKFDRLIQKDPKLRMELLGNQQKLLDSLVSLNAAGQLESKFQNINVQTACNQANTGKGASLEFLAQAKFVQNAVKIPGKPFRNFQLFLNINDLDGSSLDSIIIDTQNKPEDVIKSLTYIEGMRQLALSLNMLASTIAEGHNLIVVVMSEGGRGAALNDNDISFGFVMAPGGAGNLKDALYANLEEIDKRDSSVVKDPGGTNVTWSGDDLRTEGNLKSSNSSTRLGDLQRGVIEFLEEKTGTTGSRKGLGEFVKLRRSA
ncbi:MAG: hypothetical protein WCI18_02655 [Pseudomonadota bacterium]